MKFCIYLMLGLFTPTVISQVPQNGTRFGAVLADTIVSVLPIINTSMPTMSPTVTPVPTSPSQGPTDSPAPSPSPSLQPSMGPTSTLLPTLMQSDIPTESPAPSPSPSWAPTMKPSVQPSDFPSASPSFLPTNAPSESPSDFPSLSPSETPTIAPSSAPSLSQAPSSAPSPAPSGAPSSTPTGTPSSTPTMSAMPSGAPSPAPSAAPSLQPSATPSAMPSSSAAPSGSPTFSPTGMPTLAMITVDQDMELLFTDIHRDLTEAELAAFQSETKDFINDHSRNGNAYQGYDIEVTDLEIFDSVYIPARLRHLQENDHSLRDLHMSGVRVRFNLTAVIMPGSLPDDFVFLDVLDQIFIENWMEYISNLSDANTVFTALIEEDSIGDSEPRSGDGKIAPGVVVLVVLCVIATLGVAGFAAMYAVRQKPHSLLSIRSSNSSNLPLDLHIEECDSGSTARTPQGMETIPLDSPEFLGMQPTRNHPHDEIAPPRKKLSDASEFSKTKSLLDAMVKSADSVENEDDGPTPVHSTANGSFVQISDEERYKVDPDPGLGLKLTNDVLAAHASEVGRSDPPCAIHHKGPDSFCYSTDDNQSFRSLPWTPTTTCGTPMEANTTPGGFLGARPMGATELSQYQDDNLTMPIRRSGLYDVFAPSGALGIVVDTTRDGPVVHSMKPSSPLLGLVSPGDLIVGLDDMDTRSMTAATLTRIMAKRAQQPERKITLLAVEGGPDVEV